jgi:hypothetical protein
MIYREMLNSLTEEESGMLLHIINVLVPRATPIELGLMVSYQFPRLCIQVKEARAQVKDEAVPIYESMCRKLSIPLEVTI